MEKSEVVKMGKSIGERSIYTQGVVDLFKNTRAGEIVKYEDISRTIGMECRPGSEGYGYVYSALRIMQKEFDIVLDNVRRVGYKHRDKNEVGEESMEVYKVKIRAINRKTQKRLNTLIDSWDKLSEKARTKAIMTRTLLAFNNHILKPKNIHKLEASAGNGGPLGFRQTIELFKNK